MNASNDVHEGGEGHDSTEVVELCEISSPAEASAIRAMLDEAGIQAEIVGNLAGGAFDLPMNVSALKVWVHARDLDRAHHLLAEARRHHDEIPIDEESHPFDSR